jgi:hypothetical protein
MLDSEPFVSDDLEMLSCGTVELRVPLRAGVIQIGARGVSQAGTIRVRKGPQSVSVVRVDGEPIAVDIVGDAGGPGDQADPTTSSVFHQPVPELRLLRISDHAGPARWYAVGASANITRRRNIKQFADTIGIFALAKQRGACRRS